MGLGRRLKESRINKGYSQGFVADQMKLSRQSISKWENQKNKPDLNHLIKLSELYGVSIDELLKGNKQFKKDGKTANIS